MDHFNPLKEDYFRFFMSYPKLTREALSYINNWSELTYAKRGK